MKKNNISFIEYGTDVPIVKFNLDNGVEALGIIDTGSESTLFDSSFVKNNKSLFRIEKTKEKINFIGISDSNEVPILYGTSPIYFNTTDSDSCKVNVKGMIISLSHLTKHLQDGNDSLEISAIFGSDLLANLGANINFIDKRLTLEDDTSCK